MRGDIVKGNKSARRRLNLWFIAGAAATLLIALFTAYILEFIFIKVGIIDIYPDSNAWWWVLIFIATSIIIGLSFAMILSKFLFKPVNTVLDGMTKLSEGDFSTRIDLGRYEGMKKLAGSFNSLAAELESMEILRSDFVNDFSHELKTPIVSISGLISLMKNEKLSDDKRRQYLSVMEEEANRLTQMTSNALYLSKIETQNILTNRIRFNLSEQIRSSVLLLERKWTKKSLSLCLDFDEYYIIANEDMLKQVWVNLIDNAIKFSTPKAELKIAIEDKKSELLITVENFGEPIPKEDRELIFNKFYQCDKSRSTEGNGIGLSIVKHIITLHSGSICVDCRDGRTAFSVSLPTN